MEQFVVTNVHSAFSFDDKLTVRAMTTPVGEPSFINGMFDYIVYAKCIYASHYILLHIVNT